MEAICRIAAQKALPRAEEMAEELGEANKHNVGAYMAALRARDPTRYEDLLKTRALSWCSVLPTVGFEERVQGTIDILKHAVVEAGN